MMAEGETVPEAAPLGEGEGDTECVEEALTLSVPEGDALSLARAAAEGVPLPHCVTLELPVELALGVGPPRQGVGVGVPPAWLALALCERERLPVPHWLTVPEREGERLALEQGEGRAEGEGERLPVAQLLTERERVGDPEAEGEGDCEGLPLGEALGLGDLVRMALRVAHWEGVSEPVRDCVELTLRVREGEGEPLAEEDELSVCAWHGGAICRPSSTRTARSNTWAERRGSRSSSEIKSLCSMLAGESHERHWKNG